MVSLYWNKVYTVPNSPVGRKAMRPWGFSLVPLAQLTADLCGTDFTEYGKGIRRSCSQSTIENRWPRLGVDVRVFGRGPRTRAVFFWGCWVL